MVSTRIVALATVCFLGVCALLASCIQTSDSDHAVDTTPAVPTTTPASIPKYPVDLLIGYGGSWKPLKADHGIGYWGNSKYSKSLDDKQILSKPKRWNVIRFSSNSPKTLRIPNFGRDIYSIDISYFPEFGSLKSAPNLSTMILDSPCEMNTSQCRESEKYIDVKLPGYKYLSQKHITAFAICVTWKGKTQAGIPLIASWPVASAERFHRSHAR